MVKVGDRINVTVSGKTFPITVLAVTTIPFGTTLPENYLDITTAEDQQRGFRVGVKA